MSRAAAVLTAAVLVTLWFGPIAAADREESPPPASSTKDVPISLQNTTIPMPDPDAHPRQLASTGADVVSIFLAGLALVVSGALAVALTRPTGGAA